MRQELGRSPCQYFRSLKQFATYTTFTWHTVTYVLREDILLVNSWTILIIWCGNYSIVCFVSFCVNFGPEDLPVLEVLFIPSLSIHKLVVFLRLLRMVSRFSSTWYRRYFFPLIMTYPNFTAYGSYYHPGRDYLGSLGRLYYLDDRQSNLLFRRLVSIISVGHKHFIQLTALLNSNIDFSTRYGRQ